MSEKSSQKESMIEKLGNGGAITGYIRVGVILGVVTSTGFSYNTNDKFAEFERLQTGYRLQMLESISELKSHISSMSSIQDANRERIRALEERLLFSERKLSDLLLSERGERGPQ